MNRFHLVCSLGLFTMSSSLLAWGERGHDAVARVAVRLTADGQEPAAGSWGKLLAQKEHMIGHLANVPDIVWRRLGPEIDRLNAPSHFVDMEYVLEGRETTPLSKLPIDFAAYKKALEKNCSKSKSELSCAPGASLDAKLEKAGHAPFRIQALMKEITTSLRQVKANEANPALSKEARQEPVDKALLYAGVLAHFVGDLANPHHTSVDYDGWLSDAGGLHSYFESEMVDAQELNLEAQVLDEARRHHPAAPLWKEAQGDAVRTAWALALESHGHLNELLNLDKTISRLKPSEASKHERAVRKAPDQVKDSYRDLLILRLAMGADALQNLWTQAWVDAGKPDLSFYKSYYYPVQPDFIALGYHTPKP